MVLANMGAMTAHLPRLPFSLDPLIRQAKRRGRRKQALVVAAAVLAAGAAVGWFVLRPAGGGVFCAKPPGGWQTRSVHHFGRTDLVLTNFRFGNLADNDGLLDAHLPWPSQGAMLTAIPWSGPPSKRGTVVSRLNVRRSQFVFSDGAPHWITSRFVHYKRSDLLFWVELRALTISSLANANRALATVRPCSL
jgi:hypothetical protein